MLGLPDNRRMPVSVPCLYDGQRLRRLHLLERLLGQCTDVRHLRLRLLPLL